MGLYKKTCTQAHWNKHTHTHTFPQAYRIKRSSCWQQALPSHVSHDAPPLPTPALRPCSARKEDTPELDIDLPQLRSLCLYAHTHTLTQSYAMVFMPVRAGKVKGYKSQGKKEKSMLRQERGQKLQKKSHRVTSSFLFNIIDSIQSCWYELCHHLCVIYIHQHSTQLIHSSHY